MWIWTSGRFQVNALHTCHRVTVVLAAGEDADRVGLARVNTLVTGLCTATRDVLPTVIFPPLQAVILRWWTKWIRPVAATVPRRTAHVVGTETRIIRIGALFLL